MLLDVHLRLDATMAATCLARRSRTMHLPPHLPCAYAAMWAVSKEGRPGVSRWRVD